MSVSSVTQSGWRNVKLREVIARAQGGFASGERSQDGVIQLRMNNVTTRGGFDWSSYIRVPADPQTVAEYQLQSGDVVFNNTDSTELVGKSVYFEKADEPIVFSNHFTRLSTRTDILDPRFLAYWLQSAWQRGLFAEICNRWIGQSAVQRDKLLELPIALPSIGEQKRISAILNEQIAAVEKARAAAEDRFEAASCFGPACLRSVFSSEASSKWHTRKLSEISEIVGGIQKTPDRVPRNFFRPYLTVRNVQRGSLDLSQTEEFEVTRGELERLRLLDRDILIVEGNGISAWSRQRYRHRCA